MTGPLSSWRSPESLIGKGNNRRLIRSRFLPFHYIHLVSRMDDAALEDFGKDAFPRHNAVANGFIYRTVTVAGLADLSDFQQDVPAAKQVPTGSFEKIKPSTTDFRQRLQIPRCRRGDGSLQCFQGPRGLLDGASDRRGHRLEPPIDLKTSFGDDAFGDPRTSLLQMACIFPIFLSSDLTHHFMLANGRFLAKTVFRRLFVNSPLDGFRQGLLHLNRRASAADNIP